MRYAVARYSAKKFINDHGLSFEICKAISCTAQEAATVVQNNNAGRRTEDGAGEVVRLGRRRPSNQPARKARTIASVMRAGYASVRILVPNIRIIGASPATMSSASLGRAYARQPTAPTPSFRTSGTWPAQKNDCATVRTNNATKTWPSRPKAHTGLVDQIS